MSGFLPLLLVPGIRLLRAAEGGQPRGEDGWASAMAELVAGQGALGASLFSLRGVYSVWKHDSSLSLTSVSHLFWPYPPKTQGHF